MYHYLLLLLIFYLYYFRDPNGIHHDADSGSNEKPKSKIEKIFWPEYNDTHQKYLLLSMYI